MGLKYVVVATLLLVLILAITCSGHTTHYIKPTPDTACPAEPCLTLSEYAQPPHNYFISDTTLLLLPGVHVLSVNFTVENVSSFEICSQLQLLSPTNIDQKSRVVCEGLVGLLFRNVSQMTLDGLTFNSCGKSDIGSDPEPDYLSTYSVSIIFGEDVNIFDCSFEDSVGTALGVYYSTLHLHGNSFTNNCNVHNNGSHRLGTGFVCDIRTTFITANRILQSTSAKFGGGITAKNSILNFIGKNIFRNNSAKYGGGINACNTTLQFTGDITFADNSAQCGGGISALNSTLNIAGNSSFTGNTAEHCGGGICLQNCILISTGKGTFSDNSAKYFGGGIKANGCTLNFTGNNAFKGNSAAYGGGLSINKSTLYLPGNCTFTGNIAEHHGGGIYVQNSTLISTGNGMFRENSAKNFGGGIKVDGSTLNFMGNLVFRDNSAEVGGGISLDKSILNLTGENDLADNTVKHFGGAIYVRNRTLISNRNSTFRDNSAKYFSGGIKAVDSTLDFPGVITFTGNSAVHGGGISISKSTLSLSGKSSFTENTAEYFGGGIYVKSSTLISSGNSMFTNNSVRNFGAGIKAVNSTLSLTGNITFTGNSAAYGGAISINKSTLYLPGNCNFTSNSAEHHGGGIYVHYSTLILTRNGTFRDNSAKNLGGGIKAEGSTLNFTGNLAFRGNSAACGGGISVDKCTQNLTGNSSFTGNTAEHFGGGIYVKNSTLISIGNSTFTDNSVRYFGGGIGIVDGVLNFSGNITLRGNSAEYGGGISIQESTLNLTGKSSFPGNTAEQYGGGIYVQNSTLISSGNTTYRNNIGKHSGGGIYADGSTLNFTGNNIFVGNSAEYGGGVKTIFVTLNFTGDTIFIKNSVAYGGGLYALYSILSITGNTTFRNNSAKYRGGSIYTLTTVLNIAGSRVDSSSRKYYEGCSIKSLFMHNSAEILGGAVYTLDSTLTFEGCNTFSGNSAWFYGGGVHSQNSALKFSGNTHFISNSVQYNGGGIHGLATNLYLSGNSRFTENTAGKGGAEYLASSFILLSRNAAVTMDNNIANEYGGAVYVEDSYPIAHCTSENLWDKCFLGTDELLEIPQHAGIQPNPTYALPAYLNVHLHFCNNHAQIAGSAVYGGSVDICRVRVGYKPANGQTGYEFLKLYDVFNIELEENSVSSDPFRVCLCEGGSPSCNISEDFRQVYPGELLRIPVVAVGQNNGVVPSVIRANFTDTNGNASLAQFQDTQEVKNNCTKLYYQVHSSIVNNSNTLVLYADGPCSTAGKLLSVSLDFLPCPPGFSLNFNDSTCGCEPRIRKYTTTCNITERTLTREGDFWVGYDNYYGTVILHPHCPFDYCKPATDHISFPLNNTDLQCENSRSGILCGGCKSGLSLALGSSKCLQCTNIPQLMLIPFALAGIALVLLLIICKLTVAAGTINGLIFYANIITVNRAIFFPPNQTNILTVFISWVNLDLGIEVCFFNGMDEYSKTWLQFIFPLYVWTLVVLIIIVSEYSSRISRLFGSNPVAVLATLFLLSYGKLLRTVITAMFFTTLDYSDEVNVAVWLCDGNIRYFHGKHIALFLVALFTLLLCLLPYTLLLTVGQWLQANFNQRWFHWINKPRIKPFLDAYQAPYRDQHRYWTGLLLCLRCALFLVFACNIRADPSINLLAISSVAVGLTVVTRYTGAVYRKLCVDFLETSFVVNLGILAIATYYVKLAVVPVNQAAVVYTSVGIAFVTFIVVVLYHTYLQVWPKLQKRIHHLRDHEELDFLNHISYEEENNEPPALVAPTTTTIDPPTPEPLDTDSCSPRPFITPYTNSIELREPLELINIAES